MEEKTKIVVYVKDTGRHAGDLAWLFEDLMPAQAVESCDTVSDLASRLSVLHHGSLILLLMPSDCQELQNIQAIRHLLDNLRIILLLPDASVETIMAGHSLHPRYVSFLDSSLMDVKAVLRRMTDPGRNNTTW